MFTCTEDQRRWNETLPLDYELSKSVHSLMLSKKQTARRYSCNNSRDKAFRLKWFTQCPIRLMRPAAQEHRSSSSLSGGRHARWPSLKMTSNWSTTTKHMIRLTAANRTPNTDGHDRGHGASPAVGHSRRPLDQPWRGRRCCYRSSR